MTLFFHDDLFNPVSMIKQSDTCSPEKYKFTTFLASTSIIGILLMFVAVYNASVELELIHAVESTHQFSQHSLKDLEPTHNGFPPELPEALREEYSLFILKNGKFTGSKVTQLQFVNGFPVNIEALEKTRINDLGGTFHINEQAYSWTMLTVTGMHQQVLVVHPFITHSNAVILGVYSKRLLIPALFYVWLMVWAAFILRHLTARLKSQNDELERMALHDSLTNLPNRRLFNDRLQKLIQSSLRTQREFAVVVIDLNNFKRVNDVYGHDQGDELLRQFANRVRHTLREADTAARIGGDEFVLLLDDIDEQSCVALCERIRVSAVKSYFLSKVEATVGISIGIAMSPEHGSDPTLLISNADKAMYSIKSRGGGVHVYNSENINETNKTSGSVIKFPI